MISTAEVVESLVQASPLLEDGLSRGIISYSALARDLSPQIEKRLYKPVTRGAIVMALKRVSKSLLRKQQTAQKTINLRGLTVRSNLAELTYANSETIAEKYKRVFALSEEKNGVFCTLSQGAAQTMIIIQEDIKDEVKKIFKTEHLIAGIEDISAITMLLTEESVMTTGVYYSILKLLAWNNINIIDIISTYSELTIMFSNKDIDKAFTILRTFTH